MHKYIVIIANTLFISFAILTRSFRKDRVLNVCETNSLSVMEMLIIIVFMMQNLFTIKYRISYDGNWFFPVLLSEMPVLAFHSQIPWSLFFYIVCFALSILTIQSTGIVVTHSCLSCEFVVCFVLCICTMWIKPTSRALARVHSSFEKS